MEFTEQILITPSPTEEKQKSWCHSQVILPGGVGGERGGVTKTGAGGRGAYWTDFKITTFISCNFCYLSYILGTWLQLGQETNPVKSKSLGSQKKHSHFLKILSFFQCLLLAVGKLGRRKRSRNPPLFSPHMISSFRMTSPLPYLWCEALHFHI